MEQRLHFLGCRDGHHFAPSLSDFFEGADQWREVVSLLPVLVLLELILSADNAVALAAIARSSRQPEQERLALNLGIGIALVLRIALIVVAQWVLQNAWVQLHGCRLSGVAGR
jgi:predicted tellurium resistance membrane protein TerC